MRKIEFRGQTRRKGEKVYIDGTPVNSQWVYGGICQGRERSIIYGGEFEDVKNKHVVYSDTVGQYTGLTDKNGTKIFEGDIVRNMIGQTVVVEYLYGYFYPLATFPETGFWNNKEIEVIGNIHDNTEMLRGE